MMPDSLKFEVGGLMVGGCEEFGWCALGSSYRVCRVKVEVKVKVKRGREVGEG